MDRITGRVKGGPDRQVALAIARDGSRPTVILDTVKKTVEFTSVTTPLPARSREGWASRVGAVLVSSHKRLCGARLTQLAEGPVQAVNAFGTHEACPCRVGAIEAADARAPEGARSGSLCESFTVAQTPDNAGCSTTNRRLSVATERCGGAFDPRQLNPPTSRDPAQPLRGHSLSTSETLACRSRAEAGACLDSVKKFVKKNAKRYKLGAGN